MDTRRPSGSYPRTSSQYYDTNYNSISQAPLTDTRQSFSTRAGREATDFSAPQDSHYTSGQYYYPARIETWAPPPKSNSAQQPLAALHMPKPRRHKKDENDDRGPHRDALSPTSPLSPLGRSGDYSKRRGSVSDKSPLQKLEGKLDDISKEEKRARMEEAEHRAMERRREQEGATANQSRKIGNQLPSHASNARQVSARTLPAPDLAYSASGARHSSAPQRVTVERGSVDLGHRLYETSENGAQISNGAQATDASNKFRRASDALRMQNYDRSDRTRNSSDHQQVLLPATTSREPNRHVEAERESLSQYRHRARDAGFAGAAAAAYKPDVTSGVSRSEQRNNQRTSLDHGGQLFPPVSVRGDDKRFHETSPPQDGSTDDRQRHISSGQQAGGRVGLDNASSMPQSGAGTSSNHQTRHGGFFHSDQTQDRKYQRQPVLEEWRTAGIVKLTREDMVLDDPNAANQRKQSGRSSGGPESYDGAHDEETRSFRPPLYLQCGPLLRYTGLRCDRVASQTRGSTTDREVWRGSVMIVTQDNRSNYQTAPILRLFAQPMEPMPSSPSYTDGMVHESSLDYNDPIAGQVKVSRTGRSLYVKPVDQLEEGVDASRIEDDSGLFGFTPPASYQRQNVSGPDGKEYQHGNMKDRSRFRRNDGEKAGKYREIRGARLHADRGVTFWRFNLEIELGSVQTRVAYRINRGPAIGFWVPGKGEAMNIMFHSCNGFSLSVDPNVFSGPDPLWRDVLNKHQSKPFHVMLGGGDQIYNDAATRDTELFKEWLQIKNPERKHRADFTEAMQAELEDFYVNRYSMWFSQGLFGLANSSIPMINILDDHDILDGYGSYPHHFMSTKVFTGLGAVAFKYYMLFQHQSVVTETQREEPSWVLGASPGPYINELSRSVFMFLGHKVAFLGLDCRTERMRDEILSQESYDIAFDRCRREIVKGETKHLIVLLGVPIAYPRLNFLENILTSRIMDPIKAIGRTGVLGGFVNKFDGGVEILDDLDDHWTAKHHKAERNWFIQELQELAAEKSVRVTILGGDVHLGAVGQFYTKKKFGISKDRDHRYMPNVISSAIVNTPPPNLMGDILNKRNKIHHLDAETDEDMIPMFEQDVDGKPRNNLHLLPRRNYCTICEYVPGTTPPPSPRSDGPLSPSIPYQSQESGHVNRQYPPGSMKRTLSLTGGSFRPENLVRRLSGSRMRRASTSSTDQTRMYASYNEGHHDPDMRLARNNSTRPGVGATSYFPPGTGDTPGTRPTFHRQPTDLSEKRAIKAAARGGAEGNIEGREPGHIDLEGGLDVALNMEIDQGDPAGLTRPYRLLVPALWYEGQGDVNTARFKSRGASMMDRLRGRSKAHGGEEDYSGTEGESRGSIPEQAPVGPGTSMRSNRNATPGTYYGNDGTNDHGDRDFGSIQSSAIRPADAPNRAYGRNSQLPLGTHQPRPSPPADEKVHKRTSGGLFGFRRPKQDHYDNFYVDDSQTESDFESVESEPQSRQRRPSKTDRFFGLGNDGEGANLGSMPSGPPQLGPNGLPYDGKGKGWRIWK